MPNSALLAAGCSRALRRNAIADAHWHQHWPHAGREHWFERAAELYRHRGPSEHRQPPRAVGKIYGVEIVIGEDTRIAAGDAIIVRRLDRVSLYGRTGGLAIYELLGMAERSGAEIPEWVRSYEAALAAHESRCWSEAIKLLETVAAARGVIDRPSDILLERCRAYLADPPPDSWTPISVRESK